MMCGHAKELIAASWTGELDPSGESKLQHHLSGCAECSAEMSQLSSMWERLADLPAPEPSQALNERWKSTLASLSVQRTAARGSNAWRFSLSALLPQRPVWQVTAALVCLAIGLAAGITIESLIHHSAPEQTEIAKLREEVAGTKEMVALSLLQQQSATERLRGVDYSVRMPTMEPQVVSALIQAVNHDANVNVRLAAIDALSKVSGNANVRQSLTQSIGRQESPMVQAALIDYMVDARDRQALGPIRRLAEQPGLDPAIRQRADRAMQQLTEYR